jgi:hypothetical protein
MMLPVLLSASLSMATLSRSGVTFSTACASDSVAFSHAEADSIAAALDSDDTRIRLLRVELDQCRALARRDSIVAATNLRAIQQPWYERALKHPLLWFMMGTLIGEQVARGVR